MTDNRTIQIQTDDGIQTLALHDGWLKEALSQLDEAVSSNNPKLTESVAMTLAITYWFFQKKQETAFKWAFENHDMFDPQTVDNMFEDNLVMLSNLNGHMLEAWRSKTAGNWEHRFLDLVYLD